MNLRFEINLPLHAKFTNACLILENLQQQKRKQSESKSGTKKKHKG